MRYYEFMHDGTIAGVGTDRTDSDLLTEIHYSDRPFAPSWRPLTVHGFVEGPQQRGDFPTLHSYPAIPVCSQRAWDILRRLIRCRWEALPIDHPSGNPYYLIHVMETIDCLDVEQSKLKRFDEADGGWVMEIVRYALKPEMLIDKHIFKLTPETTGSLLLDDTFRAAVETNGLTGLEFRPLPMARPRGNTGRK